MQEILTHFNLSRLPFAPPQSATDTYQSGDARAKAAEVRAALSAGQPVVISAPPGTGKSVFSDCALSMRDTHMHIIRPTAIPRSRLSGIANPHRHPYGSDW